MNSPGLSRRDCWLLVSGGAAVCVFMLVLIRRPWDLENAFMIGMVVMGTAIVLFVRKRTNPRTVAPFDQCRPRLPRGGGPLYPAGGRKFSIDALSRNTGS
jgi:hypothetical protein